MAEPEAQLGIDDEPPEEQVWGVVDPSQYAPCRVRPLGAHQTRSTKLRRTPEAARAFAGACAQLEDVFGFAIPQTSVVRALERVFVEHVRLIGAGLVGEFPRFSPYGRAPLGPEHEYREACERYLADRIRVALRRAPLPGRLTWTERRSPKADLPAGRGAAVSRSEGRDVPPAARPTGPRGRTEKLFP